MARAISSLPVPDSPEINTVDIVLAMRCTMEKISCIRALRPMMLAKVNFSSSALRRWRFSSSNSFRSTALRTMIFSSSMSKGLAM